MAFAGGKRVDRRAWPVAAILAALCMPLLSTCASDATIEDAVPHAAADGTYGGPRDTGQYPNLNIPQKAATSQFTTAQVTAKTKELDAAKTQAAARPADASAVTADAARMRALGKSNANDVLKDIEGQ